MDVNKPFTTEESDVEAAQAAVADFDSLAAFKVSEFDAAIEQALLDVSIAEAERNRIASRVLLPVKTVALKMANACVLVCLFLRMPITLNGA